MRPVILTLSETSSFILLCKDFIWERIHTWAVGGGGRGERRGKRDRLHAERGAQCGAQSHNPEIMTRAEIKSQTFNQLNHPGTPKPPALNCDFKEKSMILLKICISFVKLMHTHGHTHLAWLCIFQHFPVGNIHICEAQWFKEIAFQVRLYTISER